MKGSHVGPGHVSWLTVAVLFALSPIALAVVLAALITYAALGLAFIETIASI